MASSARIDELLKKFEENPRRYFAPLANEYRKAGDVERAIQLCREHLPQQPGHMSGHIVFGQALFEAHQFDEARQVFTAALALDPENLIALRHLGDIARGEGDLVAARDWYQRVLDADPRNEEIGTLLASLDSGEIAPREAEHGEHQAEPASEDITPIHLSTGAFGAVAGATSETSAVAETASEPAPAAAADAPRELSAMDFALASIGSDAPPARDSEPSAPPSAPEHGESEFDIAYVTGGMAGSDEMELTPAHGASALVSHAEPADDASAFNFGEVLGGDDDRSPLELEDEEKPVSASAPASEPQPVAPAAAPTPAPQPAPRATDDRPLGLESMEFVPPSRDAEPDPMQGHLLRDEEPAAGTPAAFVTETMAELYLQQGFRDEALAVYRQLAAQSPADENLRDRVAQLESGSVSSVSVAGISDTVIEAARQRQTAPAPKKSAREFFSALANWRPAPSGGHGGEPGDAPDRGDPMDEHVASARRDPADLPAAPHGNVAGAGEAAVDEFGFPVDFDGSTSVVHRDLGAPPAEEQRRGLDLGAALIGDDMALDEADDLPAAAAIEPATLDFAADEQDAAATREAGESLAMTGFDVVPAEEMSGDRYGQTDAPDAPTDASADAGFAPMPGVGRLSGPVDTLFGDRAVPSRDEAAATALASAFGDTVPNDDAANPEQRGGTPRASMRQPTGEVQRTTGSQSASTAARQAGSELSLDHVFRETPRRGTEKRREAPAFSFDQFFSDGSGARAAEAPAAATPADGTESNGDGDADIEQFNAWLEGLKRK